MERSYNFNAGPTALPLPVLEKAQQEFLNYQHTGMSVMELSHRSTEYDYIHNRATDLLRELMAIPENYDVLLLQGGASLQFSMIPMNFLKNGVANYIITGSWSKKAVAEAKKFGQVIIGATSEETNFDRIPDVEEMTIDPSAAYTHLTSNNTIYGTQWQNFPMIDNDLIVDMSSDILSRPIDVSKFALIYAGAQKNLGPAGVTVVIIRKDLLEKAPDHLPAMLDYRTFSQTNSLYNTPPSFSIYMLSLVLEWVKNQGGTEKMAELNEQKATLLYNVIDESNGFYTGHAQKKSRSLMNVTFTLPNQSLTEQFLSEANRLNFYGLSGHRSVGGCRASIYNAVPIESVEKLCEFMRAFQKDAVVEN